jgi:excinuclease ABC subunit C
LQTMLNLACPPRIIDCFDVSHTQGMYIVGSCVRFTNGLPDPSGFRRFRIKTLTGQDDYAALQEIVLRRYTSTKGTIIPDVILIDGGKGQLSAALEIIRDLEHLKNSVCISLAKREERIFTQFDTPGAEGIKLDMQTAVGQLLIALRDYAHHFAISYHRLLRKKNFIGDS